MKISAKENVLYSIGGLILIVMIFSGWKGMLAAALILGWLAFAAKFDRTEAEDREEEREEQGEPEQILSFETRSAQIRAQKRKAS